MIRTEFQANEALASSPKAKRYARLNYVPTSSIGPVEICVKLAAMAVVIVAVAYLMAH